MLSPALTASLFTFTQFFLDINLVLKIFVLLTIISFVQNHLGRGAVGLAVMGIFAWFILFDAWALFGGIYVLYMLLMFGIAGVMVDFFFITGGMGGGGQQAQGGEEGHEPHGHGGGELSRKAGQMAAHKAAQAMQRGAMRFRR